ncbi:MAG TPA: serine hydrolase domain-containing protein [Terriglobales bacterium]|nr:serine hydrolase domain-containing protein [Terriglobales bacterium]
MRDAIMKRPFLSFVFFLSILFGLTITACGSGGGEGGGRTIEPPPPAQFPVSGPDVPGVSAYDNAIIPVLQKWNIPGASVAVAKNGKLVLARGYGYADVDAKTIVQPDSMFRIASISKPITAAAVLHLVEQQKIDLDAKFLDILTDYTLPANADARLKNVTIRHLLEHAGGWDRDKSGDPMFMSDQIATALSVPAPATCSNVIQYMLGKSLDFDPGTKYAYSNFGYCILGRVIEKVTGVSYEVYVRDNLLAPMDIHAMRIGTSLLSGRVANEVKYYDYTGAPTTSSVFPGGGQVAMPYGGFYLEAMDAHGGWIASAVDLTRFMTALDGHRGPAYLSSNSLIEMTARPDVPHWTTSVSWYGLGIMVRPAEVDANWWHTGALRGGTTILVRGYNGYCWAVLLNSRPSDTSKIDAEIDQAMWKALGTGLQGSTTDLYTQYPSPNLPPLGQTAVRATTTTAAKEH